MSQSLRALSHIKTLFCLPIVCRTWVPGWESGSARLCPDVEQKVEILEEWKMWMSVDHRILFIIAFLKWSLELLLYHKNEFLLFFSGMRITFYMAFVLRTMWSTFKAVLFWKALFLNTPDVFLTHRCAEIKNWSRNAEISIPHSCFLNGRPWKLASGSIRVFVVPQKHRVHRFPKANGL